MIKISLPNGKTINFEKGAVGMAFTLEDLKTMAKTKRQKEAVKKLRRAGIHQYAGIGLGAVIGSIVGGVSAGSIRSGGVPGALLGGFGGAIAGGISGEISSRRALKEYMK